MTSFLDDVEATFEPFAEDEPPESDFTEPTSDSGAHSFDTSVMDEKKRPRKAIQYEAKVSEILRPIIDATAQNPYTVADSAALYATAPAIAESWGDLANTDPRIARAIDWMNEGVSNPYLAAMAATAPLILQVFRNHVPDLQPIVEVPIGRHRKIHLKYRIRIDKLEKATVDPQAIVANVFGNPTVAQQMIDRKVNVAEFRRKVRRKRKPDPA